MAKKSKGIIALTFSVFAVGIFLMYLSPSTYYYGTPHKCLASMRASLYESNRVKFDSCFRRDPKYSRMLDALYQFTTQAVRFKQKFIATYGEEAWDKFQDKSGASLNLSLVEDLDTATIEIKGNNARIIDEDSNNPILEFKCVNGSWVIDPALVCHEDPPGSWGVVLKSAEVIDQFSRRICKATDPEQIDKEMGLEFMKIFLTPRGCMILYWVVSWVEI